jgi:hypothetical protein
MKDEFGQIKLSPDEVAEIKGSVAAMSPEQFSVRLAQISTRFSNLVEETTILALQMTLMKENCKHVNREPRVHASFCRDCGEYFAVKTAFSKETEEWFAEQNRQANGLSSEQ